MKKINRQVFYQSLKSFSLNFVKQQKLVEFSIWEEAIHPHLKGEWFKFNENDQIYHYANCLNRIEYFGAAS